MPVGWDMWLDALARLLVHSLGGLWPGGRSGLFSVGWAGGGWCPWDCVLGWCWPTLCLWLSGALALWSSGATLFPLLEYAWCCHGDVQPQVFCAPSGLRMALGGGALLHLLAFMIDYVSQQRHTHLHTYTTAQHSGIVCVCVCIYEHMRVCGYVCVCKRDLFLYRTFLLSAGT